jgi:dipeptidyl aminopeptidase/acylaminoacyl peptidase
MEKSARNGDYEAADRALLDAIGTAYKAEFWKKISFKSTDGFKVYGYLNTPRQGKYPIIVLVHGGEHGSADSYQAHALRFLKTGFGSLAVDYRGSSGHGDGYKNAADPAGKEIDDVIKAVEYAKKLGGSTKVGLMGSSHGAFIGGNVLPRTDDVSAANLNFGGYNFVTLIEGWQQSDEPVAKKKLEVWAPVVADQSADGSAEVRALSPIYNVGKIDVPLLLIHGKEDKTIPYKETVDFYNELKKNNSSVSLKLYDTAPHGFIFRNTEEAKSAFQATENFFKKNLR